MLIDSFPFQVFSRISRIVGRFLSPTCHEPLVAIESPFDDGVRSRPFYHDFEVAGAESYRPRTDPQKELRWITLLFCNHRLSLIG